VQDEEQKTLPDTKIKSSTRTRALSLLPTFSQISYVRHPQDITRFLIWKGKGGKQKFTFPKHQHFGVNSKTRCQCPTRHAAGTVDNLIGKLRSVFIEVGGGSDWNEILGVGNPAAHHSIKHYLTLLPGKQARVRVLPKQAVPIFFERIAKLCLYLRCLVFFRKHFHCPTL